MNLRTNSLPIKKKISLLIKNNSITHKNNFITHKNRNPFLTFKQYQPLLIDAQGGWEVVRGYAMGPLRKCNTLKECTLKNFGENTRFLICLLPRKFLKPVKFKK
jgi:hypothetical protein